MDAENNANRGDLINSPESNASPGTAEESSDPMVRQSDLNAVKSKSEERLQELQEKISLSEEQIKSLMGEREEFQKKITAQDGESKKLQQEKQVLTQQSVEKDQLLTQYERDLLIATYPGIPDEALKDKNLSQLRETRQFLVALENSEAGKRSAGVSSSEVDTGVAAGSANELHGRDRIRQALDQLYPIG